MADLTNAQGSTPVELINETSGNTLVINTDGSTFIRTQDGSGNSITGSGLGPKYALDTALPGIQSSGTISALNGAVVVPTLSMGTVYFVITGTWVGTLTAEGSVDNGTTYNTVVSYFNAQGMSTATTVNDRVIVSSAGFTNIRLRATAYTSGTANVSWATGVGTQLQQIWNNSTQSLFAQVFQSTASNLHATIDSCALPTGAATAANQATEIASLAAIDAGIPTALGQTTMAASMPVVIASNQTAIPVTGSFSSAPLADGVASGTLNALNAAIVLPITGYSSIAFQLNPGTLTATIVAEASVDGGVTYTSSLFNDPISGTVFNGVTATNPNVLIIEGIKVFGGVSHVRVRVSAYTSGSATSSLRAVLTDGYEELSIVRPGITNTYLATAIAGSDGSLSRVIKTDATGIVQVNEAGIPATLGQTTMANSTSVTIASDQSVIPVTGTITSPPFGANRVITGTAASGVALTVTLPAVASSFHYVSNIRIVMYNVAARTGGAAPIVITSTNLNSLSWTFPSAGAIGTNYEITDVCPIPLKSVTVNTATTIVCPATTNVIWRVSVTYFTQTF